MNLKSAIIASIFIGAAGIALANPSPAMFQNGPGHTGTYTAVAAGGAFKEVRWKFAAGARILASPIVWNDLCYFGDDAGVFHALDAASGRERWRFRTGGAIDAAAAADKGLVYCVSRDGIIYALDAAKGALRWKFATGGEKKMDDWDFFQSSPTLSGGALYVGSGDGNLYALDAKSGKKLWQFAAGGIVHSSPAIADNTAYIGTGEGVFIAVDLKSHAEKWRFKTAGVPDIPKGEIYGSASVSGTTVYIGAKDHTLYALSVADGKLLWKSQVGAGWVIAAPAILSGKSPGQDGRVLFGRTGDYRLYCLDEAASAAAAKPVFAWSYNTLMYFFGSPAVAGDTVYAGAFNGRLVALDLATGAEQSVFQTDASKAHWDEFYTDNRFNTSLFNRFNRPGAPYDSVGLIDVLYTMGSLLSSPCVAGDTLYIGSVDGNLYALRLE